MDGQKGEKGDSILEDNLVSTIAVQLFIIILVSRVQLSLAVVL